MNKPNPGKGFRLLGAKETPMRLDWWWSSFLADWIFMPSYKHVNEILNHPRLTIFRRRIKSPKGRVKKVKGWSIILRNRESARYAIESVLYGYPDDGTILKGPHSITVPIKEKK